MEPRTPVVPLTVGLLVWIGTFLPLRLMFHELVERRRNRIALAAGQSGMFGATVVTSWGAEPWFRSAVLAICGQFVLMYIVVTSLDRFSSSTA